MSSSPSPEAFEAELASYRAFIQGMADELYQEDQKFRAKNKMGESPYLITIARRQVVRIGNAIDYVHSKKPKIPNANYVETDIDLIIRLARRFHESALSLREHPHNGTIFSIGNEWDCQYLFRALLAAYITDVRDEEWNPSVAGSSARCEFFLKTLSTMIELKYVRKSSDVRKIKSELATDFLDYGNNPQVSRVICLVYDPTHALKNPAAVQADLSGPKTGLARVDVVVSPSRD